MKNDCYSGDVIEVMLSSTVADLVADRKTVANTLSGTGIVRVLGIEPIDGPAYGASPHAATVDMAERCDLYILILGRRYGYVAENGKSATEIEYDAAYKDDPTKILVFRKKFVVGTGSQAIFAARVSEYHRGYYLREYRDVTELGPLVMQSFVSWLEERAAIGHRLNYFDHFVRMAAQKSPFPGVRPTYVVADDYVELKYRFLAKSYTIHFDKALIFKDFWGSMATLEGRFDEWREASYGRHS